MSRVSRNVTQRKSKKSGRYFDVKRPIISQNISISFRCVFKGILAYLISGSRTSLDFPGLLLFFVEIISDKVILDHKNSYLVFFENFHFFLIFSHGQFLIKIAKYHTSSDRISRKLPIIIIG